MRRFARLLVVLTMVAASPILAEKAAAACSLYLNASTSGTTPYLTTTVAVAPFTVSCSPGVYSGQLTRLNAASMILQLEKQVSGTWTVVQSGNYLSYSGTAGTYRYTVRSTGNGNAQWALDYKYPI